MSRRVAILFLLAGLLGGGGGWMFRQTFLADAELAPGPLPASPAELLGQPRPDFTLGGIGGEWVSAADFDGQILLVNFWATWCVPCRAEMPMLDQLHRQFSGLGLTVLGIAMDDVQQARDFALELGISYPVLVGMADVMATGRVYGNRAGLLPYSVLIDRDGIVRWSHLGELSRDALEEQIRLLL